MKYIRLIFVPFIMAASIGSAGDFKVIANSSVDVSAMSADEIRAIFLENKTSLRDGTHVEPVLLKSGEIHQAFVKELLGKTDGALEAYYRALVFTGRASMPKRVASDAAAVAYVSKTKGAIGYVSAGASTAGVTILEVK